MGLSTAFQKCNTVWRTFQSPCTAVASFGLIRQDTLSTAVTQITAYNNGLIHSGSLSTRLFTFPSLCCPCVPNFHACRGSSLKLQLLWARCSVQIQSITLMNSLQQMQALRTQYRQLTSKASTFSNNSSSCTGNSTAIRLWHNSSSSSSTSNSSALSTHSSSS